MAVAAIIDGSWWCGLENEQQPEHVTRSLYAGGKHALSA